MHNKPYIFYQQSSPFGCNNAFLKQRNPQMLTYLAHIDPIELKYGVSSQNHLPQAAKAVAATFEDKFQYSSITKKEYSHILENLYLVYGEEGDVVKNDVILFHQTETKLICKYFGIPQLNQMFDEDYFQFEWDMHVGQNFNEHKNNYYRDHFIHQIRDLYMILILLEKFGFYEACCNIFKERSNGRISEFVSKKHSDFINDSQGQQQITLRRVFKHYKKELKTSQEQYIDSFFFKYVIYASSMLCALFHDMGYPICHFLSVRQRISEYAPTMYMFTHNAVESFDQLASKLGSSLLFSIVSPNVIRKRLEPNKNKYEHGAYSAIAFLLQFYNTGLIHSMSPEKQCAIELAALAIFNHTSKFAAVDQKSDSRYYNMFFLQNPISFLLRFCDDLQEWDRRYFEITMSGDFMFCPKCGLPFIKSRALASNGYYYPNFDYKCGCPEADHNAFMLRPDIFIRRKIYLVSVADWVKIYPQLRTDIAEGGARTENGEELIAEINYDPYKLLVLAKANPSYAKYRLEDLQRLEKLLRHQEYRSVSSGSLAFSRIRIKYFMSANPVLVKLKILDEYIESQSIDRECKTLKTQLLGNPSIKLPDLLRDYLEGNGKAKGALDFYCSLLKECYDKKTSSGVANYLEAFKQSDPTYYNVMRSLIRDCLKHFGTEDITQGGHMEGCKEAAFYQDVERYTNYDNYFNKYYAKNGQLEESLYPHIGYHKDIYFFYLLSEAIQKHRRQLNEKELAEVQQSSEGQAMDSSPEQEDARTLVGAGTT